VDRQIPPEQELMDQFEVGRETIRKAIDMLVREGYLYIKRGIGTFVKRNSPILTLEPLISLSNLFASRGYNEKNFVLKKEVLTCDDALHQATKLPLGGKIIYINRQRTVDKFVLALEHAYFVYSEETQDYDFHNSITKFLLEHKQLHLYKLDQTFTKRKPNEEECGLLHINSNIDIIELERWSYMEESKDVYFYVKLIILSDIYDYAI
jgi:GntR family transcriptional regulator